MPAVGLRGLYGADYLPLLAALGIFPVFARVPRMTIVLVFLSLYLSLLSMYVCEIGFSLQKSSIQIFLGLSLAVCALSAFFGLLPLTAGMPHMPFPLL
jgi:hypothetical protein